MPYHSTIGYVLSIAMSQWGGGVALLPKSLNSSLLQARHGRAHVLLVRGHLARHVEVVVDLAFLRQRKPRHLGHENIEQVRKFWFL